MFWIYYFFKKKSEVYFVTLKQIKKKNPETKDETK